VSIDVWIVNRCEPVGCSIRLEDGGEDRSGNEVEICEECAVHG
jgi:hypothetical protein